MARGLSLHVPTNIVRYRFMKEQNIKKKPTNKIYVDFFIYIVYVAHISGQYCKVRRLAFVGTIRTNKRCIANKMRKDRSRSVLSLLFGFHEKLVSICSYVSKKKIMCEPTFDRSLYEPL